MAKSKSVKVPEDVKEAVLQRVQAFNQVHKTHFQVVFKKQYCFLSKIFPSFWSKPVETKLGRLEWTGDIEKWKFAVFRYGRSFYDPDEFMFDGAQKLDGTIEGAMRAGIELYP